MVNIRGEFDPETGLELLGKLENRLEAMFRAGVPADAPQGEGRQGYLRALAFLSFFEGGRASAPGEPVNLTHAGDRTDMIVVIDLETLLGGLSAASIVDNGHGVDLPVESYRRMACHAAIIPVVLDSDGVVLDQGRTVRNATRAQRRALRAMYATCAIPGCRVASGHCQPHHIRWWVEHGGPTDLHNLLPLCSRHHHCVHEGGWQIVMHPDRSLTITYTDGSVQETGPPGAERAA